MLVLVKISLFRRLDVLRLHQLLDLLDVPLDRRICVPGFKTPPGYQNGILCARVLDVLQAWRVIGAQEKQGVTEETCHVGKQ
jgi:hypothetical protein